MTNSEVVLINELWAEHKKAPFPKGYRAKDVSGIDFVMLDADVAGCVGTFLGRGTLNLYQTAILGLYRAALVSFAIGLLIFTIIGIYRLLSL